MTHWRSMMDREYLGAWDLPTERTAEIVDVRGVKLPGAGEIKANRKPVLTFKNTEKKLIVGATIGKTIAGMYGPNVEDWKGKRITLYATTTRSKGGETVECVRVRPTIPTAPARGIESHPVDEAMRERQMRGAGELPSAQPKPERSIHTDPAQNRADDPPEPAGHG